MKLTMEMKVGGNVIGVTMKGEGVTCTIDDSKASLQNTENGTTYTIHPTTSNTKIQGPKSTASIHNYATRDKQTMTG